MKILIVEDEDLLRQHLSMQLATLKHTPHSTANAEEGLYYAQEYRIDIAIIDLGLPGMSGLDMIRQLRQQGNTFPILILTARGSWQDKVQGLDAGADDYLVKPFRFEELNARLNALTRRSSGFSWQQIEADPFRLNLDSRQLTINEEPVNLTSYEYRLLEYMMHNYKRVLSKERLAEQLYSDDEGRDSNVIEVLIARLRKKLDQAASGRNPIKTVRGQGYMFTLTCT